MRGVYFLKKYEKPGIILCSEKSENFYKILLEFEKYLKI